VNYAKIFAEGSHFAVISTLSPPPFCVCRSFNALPQLLLGEFPTKARASLARARGPPLPLA